MKAENWKNIKDVLMKALNLDASERREFLDKADITSDTREEVESLLALEEESENLMRLSAVEFSRNFFDTDEDAKNTLIGQKIGVYQIVSELGQGGMGAVYLATRTDGKFKQQVALKLLKREMNTSALRQRFRQEREILASLEHPNIARLLDAGTTDDAVPFIAIEYIDGLPIDDYCNRHDLDLTGRLNLFRTVCSTVNFAHRNLIVHRDLKPSNIIVTFDGIPKLLDFGISKILSTELEKADAATITRLGVMTPSYASPEQLRNESVTTATDVYSLGVILYELLSGHRPFENKECDLKEIYHAVIDTDPPLPSSMIETISKTFSRQGNTDISQSSAEVSDMSELPTVAAGSNPITEPNRFRRTTPQSVSIKPQFLRGDLDNIILKALKKEPERRYSSAENFSEDIKRHLDGLPVAARPDTFSYRAEKFIKRNSFTVVAGMSILLAIVGGSIATFRQARIAQAERVRAENRFRDVRKLANSYLFDVYPQIENLEGSLKARETILTNALGYLDSLSNEATGDLELQSELATAYEKVGDVQGATNNQSLGDVKAGLESYAKARKLREAVFAAGPENLEAKETLAQNYYVTGRTLWNNNQTAEAEESFEKSLKLRRELAVALPDSDKAQNRLAVLLIDYSAIPAFNFQAQKTLVLLNEALQIIDKLRQKDPQNADFKKTLTRALRIMSKAKVAVGDHAGALDGLDVAVAVSQELARQFPDDFRVQRSVWLTDTMMCEVYIDKPDSGAKAAESCAKTIDFNHSVVQKEPANGVAAYDLAISYFNAARGYRLAESPSGAIENAAKAVAVMSKLVEKNPENEEYKRNIAVYETEAARAFIKLKQPDKAIETLQKVLALLQPIAADDKVTTYQYDLAFAHRLSAQAYFNKGDKPRAVEHIDKAAEIIRKLAAMNSLKDTDKNLIKELETEKAEYSR